MKLREKLLYAFFPSRCTVCDRTLYPGEILCRDCEKLLLHYPAEKAACDICGLPQVECPCGKRLLYAKSAVPFFYENDVKRSLLRMKFRGRQDLIKPYAAFITEALRERDLLKDADIITYVPMSKKELRKRNNNQAKLLADEIGKLTGLPVKQLLYKMHDTPAQHSLGFDRRKGNVLGIFEPLGESTADIENKTIIVVDDIITTGSTLNETAKTLLIFGAENVFAAAAAQGKKVIRKKSKQEKPI